MKTKIREAQAGAPTGGTTGQVLAKNSNTDLDYGWATPSGSGSSRLVTQAGHAFVVGDVLRLDGITADTYTKAQADSSANAEVEGIVVAPVVAGTSFTLATGKGSYVAYAPVATTGTTYFLSDVTPGALVTTAPTALGTIRKPILTVVTSATFSYFHNYIGQENNGIGNGGAIYTNGITTKNTADASIVQNIAHGLGVIPEKIRISFIATSGTSSPMGEAVLVYNGTTVSVAGVAYVNGLNRDMSATDIKLYGPLSGNELEFQTGVITFDATNININWTKTNVPTGVWNMVWEAETVVPPAGGSLYTVNADETISTWWTTPIQAPFVGSAGDESFWTFAFGSMTQRANGSQTSSATAPLQTYCVPKDLLTGSVLATFMNFGVGFNYRLKFPAGLPRGTDVSGGGTYTSAFVGFSDGTAGIASGDITNTASKRIGFSTYNGLLYTITCNGAAITATSLGAYVGNAMALYEIVITGTTSADFYINGILVNSETLTMPTSASQTLMVENANLSGASTGLFIGNFVMSQQL